MKILTVVGARPQFVKAAIVSRALRAVPDVQEVLVHTGQHYDENMSAIFFDELDMPRPAYNLEIGSGTHGAQTGQMLAAVESAMMAEKPDWMLTYGDTNSTLAGALAAAKLHIPVAHVEAGLRSFNRRMPEEINRILTDHVSDLLFVPTETAAANLRHEGVDEEKVREVGDVMYDAALFYGDRAQSQILDRLGLEPKGYILATIHRAENTDVPERLRAILRGFVQAAKETPLILPLHPRTRAAFQREGLLQEAEDGLRLIDPVGYVDMVALEKNAALIATDSGGVQKEAYFYRVPCLVLRDQTEWVELVERGWARLVIPTSPEAVADEVRQALGRQGDPVDLYGQGKASQRIAEALAGGIGVQSSTFNVQR
jgi:UDP-GlcNAc3NAcA epimerase